MTREKLLKYRAEQPRTDPGKRQFIDFKFKRDAAAKHNRTAIRNAPVDGIYCHLLYATDLRVRASNANTHSVSTVAAASGRGGNTAARAIRWI